MAIKMAGIFLFFILINCVVADNKSFLSNLENKLEDNICRYANYATKYLEDFNDNNLGKSEIGRLLGYEDLKPKLSEESGRQGKSMKKMSMALMPLIFHIGASSTWMLITTLLAAKSVAIGLLLLIFKIAVSSAKVSSYFTSLKAKQHHEYSWSPSVEHGHYRSIDVLDVHMPSDWHSPYSPEWVNEPPTNDYKTIPAYERINKNVQELDVIEDSREIKGDIALSSS